jgi:hypothetical protein
MGDGCSAHIRFLFSSSIQLRRAGRLQIALGGRCVLVPAGRYLCFVFARAAARGLVFPYVYIVCSQQGGIHNRFGLVQVAVMTLLLCAISKADPLRIKYSTRTTKRDEKR